MLHNRDHRTKFASTTDGVFRGFVDNFLLHLGLFALSLRKDAGKPQKSTF